MKIQHVMNALEVQNPKLKKNASQSLLQCTEGAWVYTKLSEYQQYNFWTKLQIGKEKLVITRKPRKEMFKINIKKFTFKIFYANVSKKKKLEDGDHWQGYENLHPQNFPLN